MQEEKPLSGRLKKVCSISFVSWQRATLAAVGYFVGSRLHWWLWAMLMVIYSNEWKPTQPSARKISAFMNRSLGAILGCARVWIHNKNHCRQPQPQTGCPPGLALSIGTLEEMLLACSSVRLLLNDGPALLAITLFDRHRHDNLRSFEAVIDKTFSELR